MKKIKTIILIISILAPSFTQFMDNTVEEPELSGVPSSYTLEFNRDNNPLHIPYDHTRSNNYFLIIGDWG